VKSAFRATLAVHAGARVVENAPSLARLMSKLDRRERLTIEHHGEGATCDVVWCAPETVGEAMHFRARNAQHYWVPSHRSRAALRAANVPAQLISIVRPGFPVPPDRAPRELTQAILVHRGGTPIAQVQPLLDALAGLPLERVVAERADAAALARIAAAPLVVFADTGDAWGLLGTAALAGGALVVAYADSPFLEIVPPEACVIVDELDLAVDAVRTIRAEPAAFVARGPRAAREMSRRSPDLHAGRRIRELGRAIVHGVADPHALAMTAVIAATMSEPRAAG
jgi:hypothetical protein